MNKEIHYMAVSVDEETVSIECYGLLEDPAEISKRTTIPLGQIDILIDWLTEISKKTKGENK